MKVPRPPFKAALKDLLPDIKLSQKGAPNELPRYRIDDLDDYLKQFQLTSSLAYLGAISVRLWESTEGVERHGTDDVVFSLWQCDFLARELIRVGSEQSAVDLAQGDADVEAMRMAFGLYDYFQLNETGDAYQDYDLGLAYIIRSMIEQGPAQLKRSYLIPRYLSIFELLGRTVPKAGEADIGALFEQESGLSITDFMKLGTAVLGLLQSRGTGRFKAENLYHHNIPTMVDVLTQAKVHAFLKVTSKPLDDHRGEMSKHGTPPPGLERAWFNTLWRWPLIEIAGEYLAPSAWLLVQAFTSGIYFTVREPYENNKRIHEITGPFGRIFEEHVGEELRQYWKEPDELRKETRYGKGLDGPDWTVIDGRRAVLFECKTSRPTLAQRHLGDVPAFREWLRKDIIKALKRLPKKAEDIKNKVRGLGDWPDIDEFQFVIVTLDPCWSEAAIRQLIDEELAGDPASQFQHHLMSVEELEELGSFRPKIALYDLLETRQGYPPQTDTRRFLYREAQRLGITVGSPRLGGISAAFFDQFIPDEAAAT